MWDRAIRHFAVDQDADLVIVHLHILSKVEIYNQKLLLLLGKFHI